MSTATVEGAGVELAYEETGNGPPLVLVHGTASLRSIWDEVVELVADEFRTIRYDRRGWGQSGEPEGYRTTNVEEQADDLIALMHGLDAYPALLCGHSLGGMTCLEVVLREPELVRGAVILEPPMLYLAERGTEALSKLRAGMEEAGAKHGPFGAMSAFTRALCGPGALDIVGGQRAAPAMRHPRSFSADLNAVSSWFVPMRALREIETPLVLITGRRTPEPHSEPSEVLARTIPGAELREADSAHLIANEDPQVVAEAIRSLAQPFRSFAQP